jgi:hypothetical protein
LNSGYSHLTGDDVPLLKEMQKRGEMTIEQYSFSVPIAASCSACYRCVDRVLVCRTAIRLTSRYGTLKFRLGFHAVPSMRQIHVRTLLLPSSAMVSLPADCVSNLLGCADARHQPGL